MDNTTTNSEAGKELFEKVPATVKPEKEGKYYTAWQGCPDLVGKDFKDGEWDSRYAKTGLMTHYLRPYVAPAAPVREGMRWVKCSERLPKEHKHHICRWIESKMYAPMGDFSETLYRKWHTDRFPEVEWLDESPASPDRGEVDVVKLIFSIVSGDYINTITNNADLYKYIQEQVKHPYHINVASSEQRVEGEIAEWIGSIGYTLQEMSDGWMWIHPTEQETHTTSELYQLFLTSKKLP